MGKINKKILVGWILVSGVIIVAFIIFQIAISVSGPKLLDYLPTTSKMTEDVKWPYVSDIFTNSSYILAGVTACLFCWAQSICLQKYILRDKIEKCQKINWFTMVLVLTTGILISLYYGSLVIYYGENAKELLEQTCSNIENKEMKKLNQVELIIKDIDEKI